MFQIEVVELSFDLLDGASRLLADYVHPNGAWTTREQSACRRNLERLLDSPYADMLIARSDGTCAGFIAMNWGFSTTKGKLILRIQDLYVSPEWRRQGVATALLARAAAAASEHDANRLQLETDTDNAPARTLYEGLGFEHFPTKETYMYFVEPAASRSG